MKTKKRKTPVAAVAPSQREAGALALVSARHRLHLSLADLADLTRRYDEIRRHGLQTTGGPIDIVNVRRIEDYKELLRADIDRKRVEIETLRREAGECRKRFGIPE